MTNGQFDHLSADKFWDLVYDTAKNKKKRKDTWKILMSPEYADTVRNMAEAHLRRIENLYTVDDVILSDSQKNAYKFIHKIRGQAIHAMEKAVAEGRNIRRWAEVETLLNYVAYLKDCLEDLRSYIDDRNIMFDFYSTPDDLESGEETQLDEWIRRRVRRRGEDLGIE